MQCRTHHGCRNIDWLGRDGERKIQDMTGSKLCVTKTSSMLAECPQAWCSYNGSMADGQISMLATITFHIDSANEWPYQESCRCVTKVAPFRRRPFSARHRQLSIRTFRSLDVTKTTHIRCAHDILTFVHGTFQSPRVLLMARSDETSPLRM